MATSSAPRSRSRKGRDRANLDAGPAGLIAERILSNDVVDLVRGFRAVCRPWRACSAHLLAQGVLDRRFHPRRWIMLPDTFNDVHHRRCFLNVVTGERIYPSTLRDCCSTCHILGSTSEGLVLLLLGSSNNGVVQLVNPMTGQVVDLPPAKKLLTDENQSIIHGNELRNAGVTSDSMVVLRFESFSLAIAKPGDKRWMHLHSRYRITSLLPFAGRIYCATTKNISVVQTMANRWPRLVAVADHKLETRGPSTIDMENELYEGRSWIFLVDNNGELILCHRRRYEPGAHGSCNLYRVHLQTRNMVPLDTLNGHALFISRRRSVFVASGVSQSISANTVYVCWRNGVAFDLLGGCSEPIFKKGDVAYYLACYADKYIRLE